MSVNWLTWMLKNLNRNRRRTFLTLASLAASLFLLGTLAVAYRFLNSPTRSDRTELLLMVSPRASMSMLMPLWYRDRIAELPGVEAVSPFWYFPGQYGKDDALIPALALDSHSALDLFSDWKVPEAEKQAFLREQTGAVAGRKLMQKYGWELGNHVHLTSRLYGGLALDLILRAEYTSPGDEGTMLLHWDYLNQALGARNAATQFMLRARSAADVPRLTEAIDAQFRNAPVETRTGTLKQAMLDFLSMLGNVKLMLLWICGAVLFAVLLVVANTMGMAIRERTVEIATLRTLGYRPRHILGLLAGESLLLCLAGGVLGLAGSWALARVSSGLAVGGLMPAQLSLGGTPLAVVTSAALGIALLSTLLPAYRASYSNIAQALRFVG